jgi:hypothetical protein
MNYISIIISIIIIVIIILQIVNPFINNSESDLHSKYKAFITNIYEVNNANNDIVTIEENSLMNNNGIIDDKLSNNNNYNNLIDEKKMESFKNVEDVNIMDKKYYLKYFYRTGCIYSSQFMPLWHEIKNVLPSYVNIEEINCDRKDILGFSLCSKYDIKGVPSLVLEIEDSNKDKSNNKKIVYVGDRSYQNIKKWLLDNSINLTYNPEVEHFDNYGNYVSIDKFNNVSSNGGQNDKDDSSHHNKGIVGMVIEADGSMRKHYDNVYKNESRINEHGEYDDVDEDGCTLASFSICKENSANPGYQIFTHRGQWGCVYPDQHTSINNPFDAAFSTADHYLHSLPPKVKQVVDDKGHVHLVAEDYNANEKLNQMKKCALKYKKEFRNFGLCDNKKLNDKYNIKEHIESGKSNLPFDSFDINDYNDTKETAEALYNACSL